MARRVSTRRNYQIGQSKRALFSHHFPCHGHSQGLFDRPDGHRYHEAWRFQALLGQQFPFGALRCNSKRLQNRNFQQNKLSLFWWNQSKVAKAFDESGVQLNAPMILSQIVLVTFVIYHNANIHQSQQSKTNNKTNWKRFLFRLITLLKLLKEIQLDNGNLNIVIRLCVRYRKTFLILHIFNELLNVGKASFHCAQTVQMLTRDFLDSIRFETATKLKTTSTHYPQPPHTPFSLAPTLAVYH